VLAARCSREVVTVLNGPFKKLCAIEWVVGCDIGSFCAGLPLAHEKPRSPQQAK
jgi:hypothetical protein